jgi:catechol 2,3-dioxygenase-like lactoylglutathione lyase family enzyme
MNLGAFSVSIAVEDLSVSRAFYEKLGFEVFAGSPEEQYLVLRNGEHVIGLFHGMFEGHILTFNPGWDQSAQEVAEFTDVRDLQRMLREKGIEITDGVDEASSGPGGFMVVDPDGNRILIDQHR